MNATRGRKRLLTCCALIFVLSGYGWMAASRAQAADNQPVCIECHDNKQNAKFVHPPALDGECEMCHTPTPKHLEDGGPGGMKTNRTASACYQCHDPKNTGKVVHPALEMEGECIQCHNPHGSDNKYFLVKPVDKLCFECHNPVPADAAKGSEHTVVTDGKACLNCHNPHSSDNPSLLIASPKTLCLGCHDREIVEKEPNEEPHTIPNIKAMVEGPYPHPAAVTEDGCLSCHLPHGSSEEDLLNAPFPASNYNQYVPGNDKTKNTYALCFTCHDKAMLNEKISAGDTGFQNDTVRNGVVVRENLHWFHVVDAAGSEYKDRGRSCNICHSPHGSTQPHLIRTSWTMRTFHPVIVYESKPDGGECLKSCHAPKRYRRIK